MAGITSSSRLPEPDEFDYSVSHRAVPVPAVAYTSTAAEQFAESGNGPLRARKQSDAGSAHTESGRRKSSFSFLRRNSNQSHRIPQQEQTPIPPLPATGIGQAHIEGAAGATPEGQKDRQQGIGNHTRVFSASSLTSSRRKSSTEGARMLRKSSKQRQQREEQERLAREAAAIPKQPPRLQSINPLPTLGTFGGDDARPDSYAIFNGTGHTQERAANFSRPGHAAAAMPGYHNSSSSPAYVARPGNAFQGASSSPSVASKSVNGEYVDNAFDRTESMTHRGRYSYASSTVNVNVNSPRRVRRRKDPTPFNVLVIGAKNSGKTSFINFLRQSLALPAHKKAVAADDDSSTQVNASKSSFTSHYLETEKDGERVGLTLWDSAGLEKHIIDLQLREMAAFVESKFEETFVEEQKVMRSPGAKDTHIHCVFLVLDPVRLDSTYAASASQKNTGALAGTGSSDDDMDLQIMRALWGKTTVIPVIAKADTLTVGHMNFLKRKVWDSMKAAKLDPLEVLELEGEDDDNDDALDEEDEDEDKVVNNLEDPSDSDSDAPAPKTKRNGHNRQSSLAGTVSSTGGDELPYIPMSILSPDPYDLPPFTKVSKNSKIGRRFPWGFADPYDPEHCDFVRLRDSIFSEWRADLRELARTKWYENWRTSRLKNLPGSRQRVKGGVTPVAAVPREGRTSPSASRNVSASQLGGTTTASIPRSVSGSAAQTSGIGMAISPPNGAGNQERVPGIGSDTGSLSSRGAATYRSSEAAH